MKKLLIVIALFSCNKEVTNLSLSTMTEENVSMFNIGQHYGGGVIFFIDSTGVHGLIADTVDMNPSTWWNGVYIRTTAFYDGYKNTKKIVAAEGAGKYSAIKCWHYKGSGYTDWFLPSKAELSMLYSQRGMVGGFTRDYYWSSTEDRKTVDHACAVSFFDGVQYWIDKSNTWAVRAIRKF